MKIIVKRFTSIFLVLVMLVPAFAVNSFATTSETYCIGDIVIGGVEQQRRNASIKTQSQSPDILLLVGDTTDLFLNIKDSNGNPVTNAPVSWSVSLTGYIKIEKNTDTRYASITGLKATSTPVTVTATLDGGSSKSVTVEVQDKDVAASDGTKIELSRKEYYTGIGEEFPISGEVYAPNGISNINIQWSVSDETGLSLALPASELNSDLNHLIFSTLATGWEADQFFVTVSTSNGARSTRRVIVSTHDSAYITKHINFVNSSNYDNLMQNKTSLTVIDKDKFNNSVAALTTWELIGDVGKIASLKFDDLLLCNNPFDVVLADLINSYVASSTIETSCTTEAFELYNDTFEDLMDALRSTEEWDESYSTKIKIEVKGILTDPDYKIQDSNAFSIFKKCLKKLDNDKLEDVFSGLNCASKISEAISNIGDVADSFIDAYNAYVTAKAFQETGRDFLATLLNIGYEATYADPIRSGYFIDSIGKLLDLFDGETAFDYALKNLGKSMFFKTYDLVAQKYLTNLAYSFVAKAFGCKPSAVGIVVFAYNTTYSVLDFLSAHGDKADLIYLLDAARFLEDGLLTQIKSSASGLKRTQTLKNAQLLDCQWGMLQSVENYLFQTLSKYTAKLKITTRFITKFNKAYATDDMQYALSLATDWTNTKCHDGDYSTTFEYVIKCPTDIFVYGNGSELLLKITNNHIDYCKEGIVAFVADDEKYFSIPNSFGGEIRVVGTDEGTMEYKVMESDGYDLIRCVEYKNVPLAKNRKYTTTIPTTALLDNNEYNLYAEDGRVIDCDFDSLIQKTWTITYNSNGGTGAPTAQTKMEGLALTLADEIPMRTNYTFIGWNTKANGSGATYAPGAKYTADAAATLYAQWQKNEVTLQSISVKSNPIKTTYYVGETLNTSGLVITATYSDGSSKDITSGFNCDPTTLDTAGFRTITVTYGGKSATFGVTVNNDTVKSIAVKTKPIKLIYNVNDTLSTAGLTLTVTYNSGKTETVSSGFTCSPTKLPTAGKQTITVTYQGKTTTFVVTINTPTQKKVKSVSIGDDYAVNYKATAKLNPSIDTDSSVKYSVEYKSSNTKVATVDQNGNVYGAKKWGKGTATITCTVTDECGNVVTDTCNVTCGFTWWQWIIGIVLFGWIWY